MGHVQLGRIGFAPQHAFQRRAVIGSQFGGHPRGKFGIVAHRQQLLAQRRIGHPAIVDRGLGPGQAMLGAVGIQGG